MQLVITLSLDKKRGQPIEMLFSVSRAFANTKDDMEDIDYILERIRWIMREMEERHGRIEGQTHRAAGAIETDSTVVVPLKPDLPF